VLQARFGPRISSEELLSLAEAVNDTLRKETAAGSQPAMKQPLIRTVKRRKKVMLWWFQENWDLIEPCLQHRVIIDTCEGVTL
jgi:hypothetical protein